MTERPSYLRGQSRTLDLMKIITPADFMLCCNTQYSKINCFLHTSAQAWTVNSYSIIIKQQLSN